MTSRFTVALASGEYFDAAADEDLLSAAQRANWLVRFGCRNGNCEACEALLVSGRIEQDRGARQHLLDAATPIQILLCQCRARSDLILAFDSDPTPGSYAQSRAFRAQLIDMRSDTGIVRLLFRLPAGRKPALLVTQQPAQFAAIETEQGSLQAIIDAAASSALELHVSLPAAHDLALGGFYTVRYPLGAGIQS